MQQLPYGLGLCCFARVGLAKYREMRDFARTPEPRGRSRPGRRRRLRYYVQRHDARRLHYDFRLELDGVLRSWAVPKGPSLDPAERRLAVQTEDHPLEYGEFEGVIPDKQYGAGDVLLWDRGTWVPEERDAAQALRKGRLHFRLEGEKLQGNFVLTRMREGQWLLIKRRDEGAREGEVVEERPESVKRKSVKQKPAELPRFVAPQLATLVTEPPASGDWLYEVKHDGYRMLARIAGGEARLFTRSGKDWTAKLPRLARALAGIGLDESWLDGEIVVPGEDGRSSFQRLQNAFETGADAKIVYFVFDAPRLEGRDLTRLPLRERKERLQRKLAAAGPVRFSGHLSGNAAEVLAQACRLGLEGLIGKRADSPYVSGRTRDWIKLKCRRQQDFVIAGYTAPGGSRRGFGALVLGVHDARGKLQYAGKVGTGFDEAALASLSRRLASLRRKDCPFEKPPRELSRKAKATWVRPVLVAQVAFAERTDEGLLRQASFLGLREDMPAGQVGEEKPVAPPAAARDGNRVLDVAISHPERKVWPALGITKLDLARYYEAVGDWLLPHVKDRPLSLVRCPGGLAGKCFYQRHLKSKDAYIYADSLRAVVGFVQHGVVELHTWGSSVPDIGHPDRITLDLDPDPELPWETLLEAVRLTRSLLEELKLKCFLKTTGGKGLHVVAPIERGPGWDQAKAFARALAGLLVKARPELFTANMAKSRRPGKVFVDYLRNAETASAVCAYSARARAGATVSTPLAWDELGKRDPRAGFTVKSVPRRLARLGADPWRDYGATRQSIPAAWERRAGRARGGEEGEGTRPRPA